MLYYFECLKFHLIIHLNPSYIIVRENPWKPCLRKLLLVREKNLYLNTTLVYSNTCAKIKVVSEYNLDVYNIGDIF